MRSKSETLEKTGSFHLAKISLVFKNQLCRVAIICGTFGLFISLHFVITLEAPLDVEQETACGSQGEEDGPPRTGNSIDSLGRLMLWGI